MGERQPDRSTVTAIASLPQREASVEERQEEGEQRQQRASTELSENRAAGTSAREEELRNKGVGDASEAKGPGAYLIRGQTVTRAEDSADSPDMPKAANTEETEALHENEEGRKSPLVSDAHHRSSSNMVLAAEVSSICEADLEDKVRQRVWEESAQASIVWIESEAGTSVTSDSNHPSSSVQDPSDASSLTKASRTVKEKLFGDTRPSKKISRRDISVAPDRFIRRRSLMQFVVHHSSTTQQWATAVHTRDSCHHSKQTLAQQEHSQEWFVAKSQLEAYEIGLAMAPPQKMSIDKSVAHCKLCKCQFAIFRRAAHCCNCGVAMCASCATQWPSKMLPKTYVMANADKSVKGSPYNPNTPVPVCLACDWLALEFQNSLLKGDIRKVVSLYQTGNCNLRTPYFCQTDVVNKPRKINGASVSLGLYPLHMAISSGNLTLVKWLVQERLVPLTEWSPKQEKIVPLSTYGVKGVPASTPLKLAQSHLDIFHYLITQQHLSLSDEPEQLDYVHVINHLEVILQSIPSSGLSFNDTAEKPPSSNSFLAIDSRLPNNDTSGDEGGIPSVASNTTAWRERRSSF